LHRIDNKILLEKQLKAIKKSLGENAINVEVLTFSKADILN